MRSSKILDVIRSFEVYFLIWVKMYIINLFLFLLKLFWIKDERKILDMDILILLKLCLLGI